jgi:hypothetical protein
VSRFFVQFGTRSTAFESLQSGLFTVGVREERPLFIGLIVHFGENLRGFSQRFVTVGLQSNRPFLCTFIVSGFRVDPMRF